MLGLGLAATRDVVSFLRYGTPTADDGARLVGPVSTVVGIGFSQSGRYLRDHIGQGFNQDEAGRKVFDGVLSHIAGVGRVFLNAEFGSARAHQHAARGSLHARRTRFRLGSTC